MGRRWGARWSVRHGQVVGEPQAEGRAGNEILVCQDPSPLLSQPLPPAFSSPQTLLGNKLTATSDGVQPASPGGLRCPEVRQSIPRRTVPLPVPIPCSAHLASRTLPPPTIMRSKQDQTLLPQLVPKIASLATQTRWLAASPSFKPDEADFLQPGLEGRAGEAATPRGPGQGARELSRRGGSGQSGAKPCAGGFAATHQPKSILQGRCCHPHFE